VAPAPPVRRRQTWSRTDGPFFGGLGFVTVVVTGVGGNVVGRANNISSYARGQAGGVTAPDHHKARAVLLVECSRVTRLEWCP
jgi:hypothetical protein